MPATQNALTNSAALGLRPARFELIDRLIDTYLEKNFEQFVVTQVARRGQLVYDVAAGSNTKEYGVRSDTILQVGSVSKPVIAAILLSLQEDGLVSLFAPVNAYLPEFGAGGYNQIMLWHLLTHSSGVIDAELTAAVAELVEKETGLKFPGPGPGLKDYKKSVCEKMGIEYDPENKDRMRDPLYALAFKCPPKNKPRVTIDYSHFNYDALGHVITTVTGKSIDEVAAGRLFGPLGMTDSYYRVPEDKWHKVLGRTDDCLAIKYNNVDSYVSESGGEGLKTSVADMTRFGQMVVNGGELGGKRVLSRASIRSMLKDHNGPIEPLRAGGELPAYTLGWGSMSGYKKDDGGFLRGGVFQGGFGGVWINVDPAEELVVSIITGRKKTPRGSYMPLYDPITNIVYSALD